MRLATFRHLGRTSYGVVLGAGEGAGDARVADVGAVLGGRHGDLASVLSRGALPEVSEAARRAPVLALADLSLLLPVESARIFCVGLNYLDHRTEMGHDAIANPTLFVRFSTSLVGHEAPILRPSVSDQLDYEGELAVVVGRNGRGIARADALGHVAGYSCFNDGSVRDWQRQTSQFTAGKNFDASGSFGPWIVTADEVPDPSGLELTTRVDGEVRQRATTDLMINDVASLVEYVSTFTELRPGDVIATGTPGGVGAARTPPRFLQPGSVVEVEISGIGVLRNPVVAEEGER